MPPRKVVQDDGLLLPSPELRAAVEVVCDRDRTFRPIEANFGPLRVRQWTPGFASLVRIIMGQQLSTKAAQAIFTRLTQYLKLTPANLAAAPETILKQAGLSRTKIATCQRLSQALLTDQVNLAGLSLLPDETAIEHLTQIKGIRVWTAEVYLLFWLQRLSVLPASDLAIQVGFQELKHLKTRPTRQILLVLTDPLHPYRGAVAHLLWHYYRHRHRSNRP